MYSGIKLVISDKPFSLIFNIFPFFRTTLIELAACMYIFKKKRIQFSVYIGLKKVLKTSEFCKL